jgi:hypothetical protein
MLTDGINSLFNPSLDRQESHTEKIGAHMGDLVAEWQSDCVPQSRDMSIMS